MVVRPTSQMGLEPARSNRQFLVALELLMLATHALAQV